MELLHPEPPSPKTRKALERLYVKRDHAIRPLVEAILMHPDFYRGPAMVKPPIVYIAGLLRARAGRVASDWAWITDLAGQRLFRPPNVAGWDETRWLDTSTFRGRWTAANEVARADSVDPRSTTTAGDAANAAVRNALIASGAIRRPSPTRRSRACERYAARVQAAPPTTGSRAPTAPCARTRCGC